MAGPFISERPTDGETNSLIGVVLSICGNILISFALNIQKLAHNRITRRSSSVTSSCSTSSDSTQVGKPVDKLNNKFKDDTLYLRSKLWWLGIFLMALGEIGNFMGYGYAPASIIAPLGTMTLVSNTILAPMLLDETFRKQDFVGVLLAILGAVIVVSSAKNQEPSLSPELVTLALMQMRAVIFYIVTISLILFLTALSSRCGPKNILIDLGLVALYGAYTVIATKSLSSMLNLTLYKLFTYPISYILIIVLVFTAIMQIKYLSKAMQRFDSTAVIPTQFVLFTLSAITGSAVIYRDFDDLRLMRFVLGCFVEFFGIFLITLNRDSNDHGTTVMDTPDSAAAYSSNLRSVDHSSIAMPDTCSSSIPHEHPPNETTPLFHNDGEVVVGGHHRLSKRRSSIFYGISVHSQLAGGGMGDDDLRSISESSLYHQNR
ncbi:hypothetical protein VTP01DRAFT_3083 [Rhizomucor pusillus]|uniref:uncharacterized protein n=1 Tax=Rhizomucor pusillus TaxID=4840 RepID=UPI003742B951